MPKPRSQFCFDRQTLSEISGWSLNRIYQDEVRGVLDPNDIASVAVWLAENGKDILRATMASRLLPALFGSNSRVGHAVEPMCKSEFLRVIYAADNKARKALAKRRRSGK